MDQPTGTARRTFLQCMGWGAAGLVWGLSGGVVRPLGSLAEAATRDIGERPSFTFAQISDSHIGFHKAPNPKPEQTLAEAVTRVRDLAVRPALLIHTGDVSQLSKPSELATAAAIIAGAGAETHYVPGEHDMLVDGKSFFDRFAAPGAGSGGWYAFDAGGVHFVALINVHDLQPGGFGRFGEEQLAWLERDLAGHTASTPIVVFTHLPMWTVYADWGWGTADAPRALALLKRFGSVTVLNGHIHQSLHKTEGHIVMRTAMATGFPQPAPGTAPSPGPWKVGPEKLRALLGLRSVEILRNRPSEAADINLAS